MKPEQKGLLLRILLNRAHGTVTDQILKGLPPEEAESVRTHSLSANDPFPLLMHAKKVLPQIHYSWIYPHLKDQEKVFQKGILSCLTHSQQKGLAKLCRLETPEKVPSPFLKAFYLHHLYRTIPLLSESLPLEYVKETPLTFLAEIKKQDLIALIDKLGMFDLAHEMRTIVGTQHLKALYTILSPYQQEFLRKCLHTKDLMKPKKLNLQAWKGDGKTLLLTLHKRGMIRLAYALSGQSEELIWRITHILDSGRGNYLKKLIKPEAVPSITDALIQQVQMASQGGT